MWMVRENDRERCVSGEPYAIVPAPVTSETRTPIA